MRRSIGCVGTFSASCSILKASGKIPEPDQAPKELYAAIGTPMKFTRSLPANAIASAKVPSMITSL